MRGKLGPILSGVGGFLLVLGILLNVYAYPRLATAPIDQDSISILNGPNATVFDTDPAVLAEISTELTTTAKTVGEVELSEKAGDNVRIWTNATSTKSADGKVRARSIERVAFDGFTGAAVESDEAWSEMDQGDQEAVEFEGQIFKFPFQTEKKTYQWWDSTLRRAFPAEYQRDEKVGDLDTYVFVQKIEPTVWKTENVTLGIVGEEGDEPYVADRTYSNERTFWVEPETGVVIKREEKQGATLRYEGEDRVTVTDVVTSFDEKTVQQNIDDYSTKASLLKMVRSTLPLVLGGVGVVVVLIGLLLTRRRSEA